MKTMLNVFCCFISAYFCFVTILTAKIPNDPFEGQYSIAKSAEAFLIEIATENTSTKGLTMEIFDFDKEANFNRGGNQFITSEITDDDWKCIDAATGDFSGISRDYLALVLATGTNTAALFVSEVTGSTLKTKGATHNFEYTPNDVRCVRVIAGNFDDNPGQEIALAYADAEKKIHIKIYKLQSGNSYLTELGSNNAIALAAKEKDNLELDDVGDAFDIAVLDYDGDGRDEIIMVHKLDFDKSDRELFYEIVCYDYAQNALTMNKASIDPVKLEFDEDDPGYYEDPLSKLSRPSLACGDLNGDRKDEIILGYVVSTRADNLFWAWKSELDIVEILDINPAGGVTRSGDPIVLGSYNTGYHAKNSDRHHFSRTVVCADLTGDGRDEIVCDGPDSLYVLGYESNQVRLLAGMPCNNHAFYEHHDRSFAVADVNIDTSTSVWTKEIVFVSYLPTPQEASSSGKSRPDEVRIGVAVLETKANNEFALVEKTSELIRPGSFTTTNELRYVLAPGDFDGDGLRLGLPVALDTLRDVEEPRIILNAPPVHFDVFDGVSYDVCSHFDPDGSDFAVIYTHTNGSENEFQTKTVRDWGLSSKLRYVNINAGTGIDGTLGASVGQHFENIYTDTDSYQEIITKPAIWDDWIYTTITDYYQWEYPVLINNNEKIGQILVVIPDYKGGNWFTSKSEDARYIITNHEPGNILSYARLSNRFSDNNLSMSGPNTELSNTGGNWNVTFQTIKDSSFSTETTFGFSTEVLISLGVKFSASAGGSLEPLGIGVNAEIGSEFEKRLELVTSGSYDQGEIITNRMTLHEGIDIQVNLGGLDGGNFDESVNYKVQPYTYWAKNGALVVDYITEPIRSKTGIPTFWDKHYSSHPDLAFILPWKYDVEKKLRGSLTTTERTQTKDLIFVPSSAQPGDTVGIITRIHNYSLMALNENFTVQYFIGDPDNGGEEMEVLYDSQESSKITISEGLQERGAFAYYVTWIVPSDIGYDPRIYAVLDPENEITELHEDNNKGNAFLDIKGVVSAVGNAEDALPENYSLEQNYPNPFNPSTKICFRIPRAEKVTIEIYNMLGQKVETLLNKRLAAGVHKLEFAPEKLASGIYFYRIISGDFVSTKKMILMK